MQGNIDRIAFGYVQCDIEVPEHLRRFFSNYPPVFKNTVASREDIGVLMREYAEIEENYGSAQNNDFIRFPLN